MSKYEITNKTIEYNGVTLHQIRAIKDFSDVLSGDLGGWVENEHNLNQGTDCWIYDDSKVYGNAYVSGAAKVRSGAIVYGDALIYDYADVYDHIKIYDSARIFGNAKVFDNAQVYGESLVFDNAQEYENAQVYGYAVIYNDTIIKGYDTVHPSEQVLPNLPLGHLNLSCDMTKEQMISLINNI
jgi:NDP-sugar pyrophosphorylase family protein